MSKILGENVLKRIAPSVCREMQEAIAATEGREVFFAGSLDGGGRITSVRVCSRGNAGAVPALTTGLAVREVVIHNHPSGELSPSDADLSLASMYSTHGHGVYIVDNEVTRVYVVVEPFLAGDTAPLDVSKLRHTFSPSGPLARALPRFEVRPQQAQMMEVVSRAFNEERTAVVEAPTGVGKTLAYLLPAVAWAVQNKERVVMSTRTINLQEQIILKDVPLLQRCLDFEFKACLVKGRGNYLCHRKLERTLSEASLFDDEETKTQLDAIVAWAEKTEDGSRSDLPFVPERGLWERVCSESDSCSMGRCPDKKKCFVGKARRTVAGADLVVTNHHILFSDVAIKRELGSFTEHAVLPSYDRVIFDEAHSIEDSATEYFGASATYLGSLATLGRFHRMERGQERGLIPLLKVKLVKNCPQLSVKEFETIQDLIETKIGPAIAVCRDAVSNAFLSLRTLASKECGQIGRDVKWRLTQDVLNTPSMRELHTEYILPAVDAFRLLAKWNQALTVKLNAIAPLGTETQSPVEDELVLLRAYTSRTERLANTLGEVTSEELGENTVRWVEVDISNEKFIRVARCPLEVGEPLSEWLYTHLKTVVMTSATLTVEKKFDFLFHRLGLDRVAADRVETATLDSPFDFEEQAALCIPNDLPAPNEKDYLAESTACILEALQATRGHAFVLFTSFFALNFAFERLEDTLRADGITPLKQGTVARTTLLERFRSDSASVLFATDSFWEGVDVVGEALQCVILHRLPFRVPSEPIQQARTEAIEESGKNSFMEYSVPQAVIKFRQGFGRLIRHRGDRGVILVLDQRIITKRYGRKFRSSLPPIRNIIGPRKGVMLALSKFFTEGKEWNGE